MKYALNTPYQGSKSAFKDAQLRRAAELIVYAFKIGGKDAYRKEASRQIIEQDLSLRQPEKMLNYANQSIGVTHEI